MLLSRTKENKPTDEWNLFHRGCAPHRLCVCCCCCWGFLHSEARIVPTYVFVVRTYFSRSVEQAFRSLPLVLLCSHESFAATQMWRNTQAIITTHGMLFIVKEEQPRINLSRQRASLLSFEVKGICSGDRDCRERKRQAFGN